MLTQKSFEQQFLRLVTAEGHPLTDLTASLESLGIQDGDTLTALALQIKLAATGSAFALWCCGGSTLVTWGDRDSGGDSSVVQDRIDGVIQAGWWFGTFFVFP